MIIKTRNWITTAGATLLLSATPGVAFAAPDPDATPPPSGGVTKICPPATEANVVEQLLGQLWGYADRYSTMLIIFFLIALLVVAGIPKLRAMVLANMVPIAFFALFAGLFITFVSTNLGEC